MLRFESNGVCVCLIVLGVFWPFLWTCIFAFLGCKPLTICIVYIIYKTFFQVLKGMESQHIPTSLKRSVHICWLVFVGKGRGKTVQHRR